MFVLQKGFLSLEKLFLLPILQCGMWGEILKEILEENFKKNLEEQINVLWVSRTLRTSNQDGSFGRSGMFY